MSVNRYAPDEAQQVANDRAVVDAIALIKLMNRPLTLQQQREVAQQTARAVGLLNWERKLERNRK
jgi:hypothetical protein